MSGIKPQRQVQTVPSATNSVGRIPNEASDAPCPLSPFPFPSFSLFPLPTYSRVFNTSTRSRWRTRWITINADTSAATSTTVVALAKVSVDR